MDGIKGTASNIIKVDFSARRNPPARPLSRTVLREGPRDCFNLDTLGVVVQISIAGRSQKCLLGLTEAGLERLGLQTTAMRTIYGCDISDLNCIIFEEDGNDFQRLLRHLRERSGLSLRLPVWDEARVIVRGYMNHLRALGFDGLVAVNNEEQCVRFPLTLEKSNFTAIVLIEE